MRCLLPLAVVPLASALRPQEISNFPLEALQRDATRFAASNGRWPKYAASLLRRAEEEGAKEEDAAAMLDAQQKQLEDVVKQVKHEVTDAKKTEQRKPHPPPPHHPPPPEKKEGEELSAAQSNLASAEVLEEKSEMMGKLARPPAALIAVYYLATDKRAKMDEKAADQTKEGEAKEADGLLAKEMEAAAETVEAAATAHEEKAENAVNNLEREATA